MSRSRRGEGGAVHRRRFCVSVSVWFPTVTVCPPRESNTILNPPLQAVKSDSFMKQIRDHLLDASFKPFLKNPFHKYARNIVDLVNKGNLMGLYEGTTSQPAISAK